MENGIMENGIMENGKWKMENDKNYDGLEASAAPNTGLTALAGEIRGTLKPQEPLSKHTTWRVGGPAEWFYEPADVNELKNYCLRGLYD
jgi:hypothetical protein